MKGNIHEKKTTPGPWAAIYGEPDEHGQHHTGVYSVADNTQVADIYAADDAAALAARWAAAAPEARWSAAAALAWARDVIPKCFDVGMKEVAL